MGNNVTIFINEQAYQVSADDNLLAGVLANHLNLPYFCWHPAMGSIGACRQCAVTIYQDENDQIGRITMACTTPVTEGMRIAIDDKASSDFREQIIAAMMTNHPHDCPVCGEGGECHLQDMTVMTGHTQRRYTGKKRTFSNQYLGEFVGHEMNRCITCYRCVRFYQDYAGGDDFGCFGSKNQVYFGRQQEGMLENEFSGNLVEVCPTGVFTNKLFSAHYARKWDLKSAPSICGFCSVGCNTSIGERYGSVRRVINRYNDDINGYFLCDRGRFGLHFVNNKTRITTLRFGQSIYQQDVPVVTFAKAMGHQRNKKWLGVGSGRASIESNMLLKQLVGEPHFCPSWSAEEFALAKIHHQAMALRHAPTLADVEKADWIFVVGQDVQQSHPRVALSIRQAVRKRQTQMAESQNVPHWQDGAVNVVGQQQKLPLFSLHFSPTKLDDSCQASLQVTPSRMQQILGQLRFEISDTNEPPTDSLSINAMSNDKASVNQRYEEENLSQYERDFITQLIATLSSAKRPLFISGWAIEQASLLQQFVDFVDDIQALLTTPSRVAQQLILPPAANDVGLLHMLTAETPSLPALIVESEASELGGLNAYDGIIVLENDLGFINKEQMERLTASDKTFIVLEHSKSEISECADILLPVAPISESDGHFANYQGRLQRFYAALSPINNIKPSWYWLSMLSEYCGQLTMSKIPLSLKELHEIAQTKINAWPFEHDIDSALNTVAQETHRVSGRTAKQANVDVHEPQTSSGVNIYHPSMEGKRANDEQCEPFVWSPGWNANQANYIFNKHKIKIIEKLSLLSLKEHSDFGNNTEAITTENNVVYNMAQWQKMEWQSASTIEFSMRPAHYSVQINKQECKQNGWKNGQWLKLKLRGLHNNESISIPVQVIINSRLSLGHYCSQIECLQPATWYALVDFQTLDDEDLVEFQAMLVDHQKQLTAQQEKVLSKLKREDEFIPIHMVTGANHAK